MLKFNAERGQKRSIKHSQVCPLAIVILAASLADASAESPGGELLKSAGVVIGYNAGVLPPFNFCSGALGGEDAQRIAGKLSAIHAANDAIASMARFKALALLDLQGDKAVQEKARKYYDIDVKRAAVAQFKRQFSTSEERERLCNSLISADAATFYLTRKYPRDVDRIVAFQIGYPWRSPECDFKAAFLVRPVVSAFSVAGVTSARAETPPDDGLTYISAVCSPRPPSAVDIAMRLRETSERQLHDYGVRNIVWTREEETGGPILQATGVLTRSGHDGIIFKSWWVGRKSVLEVTIGEEPDRFPSIISSEFLASVKSVGETAK